MIFKNSPASSCIDAGRADEQLEEDHCCDFNDANGVPLDPYAWAGYAVNHTQPPQTVEIVETMPKPVQQPMPETSDRKLRVLRELMRDETESQIEARRQGAVNEWRRTTSGNGNAVFFQLFVNL